MSESIEEKIADISDPHARALLELWMPILQRWVFSEGWDKVRRFIYAFPPGNSSLDWWLEIRSRMTVEEARAEDERSLAVEKQMAKNAIQRLKSEQQILRDFFTALITKLIGKI
jgi:hypothetical protein